MLCKTLVHSKIAFKMFTRCRRCVATWYRPNGSIPAFVSYGSKDSRDVETPYPTVRTSNTKRTFKLIIPCYFIHLTLVGTNIIAWRIVTGLNRVQQTILRICVTDIFSWYNNILVCLGHILHSIILLFPTFSLPSPLPPAVPRHDGHLHAQNKFRWRWRLPN